MEEFFWIISSCDDNFLMSFNYWLKGEKYENICSGLIEVSKKFHRKIVKAEPSRGSAEANHERKSE